MLALTNESSFALGELQETGPNAVPASLCKTRSPWVCESRLAPLLCGSIGSRRFGAPECPETSHAGTSRTSKSLWSAFFSCTNVRFKRVPYSSGFPNPGRPLRRLFLRTTAAVHSKALPPPSPRSWQLSLFHEIFFKHPFAIKRQ